jgi:N-formylglutamate amidohydrolase
MSRVLPIAILSPHGGLAIPPQVNGRIALSPQQIFNESDAYIDELFDFRDCVLYYETFSFGRTIIDINRADDGSLPQRSGDGIVKTITGYGDTVYLPGMEPDAGLKRELISTYWQPWHNRLHEIAQDSRVKLVLDCHSMAAVGPTKYDDGKQLRPRIEVANLGDEQGAIDPQRNRLSASAEIAHFLSEQLFANLADMPDLTQTAASRTLNTPFWGGWNIWNHGSSKQPWLMIELNRALYIGDQAANSLIVPIESIPLKLLRERLWRAIVATTEYVLANSRE